MSWSAECWSALIEVPTRLGLPGVHTDGDSSGLLYLPAPTCVHDYPHCAIGDAPGVDDPGARVCAQAH